MTFDEKYKNQAQPISENSGEYHTVNTDRLFSGTSNPYQSSQTNSQKEGDNISDTEFVSPRKKESDKILLSSGSYHAIQTSLDSLKSK